MFWKRLGAFFLDILEVVVFAIAIFLFIYLLVMQPHKIKGDSMQPNFPNGEYLLTDKVSYRLHEPERGDVVVFEAPGTNGDEYIKRIIGLPGEKVSLFDGKVYVNSKLLTEVYIAENIYTPGSIFLKEGQAVTVPQEHLFVLGDNRSASSDSRTWGFVSKDKISGKAWLIYWPPANAGLVSEVTYNTL
ncbi:signal peptidase I [Candidatus Woesebacteria bacterium RIFCSPHIGHO2_01_FULL_37_10]|uniref:Signal peptidase I n=1 Tax=Candidatus Woesebacteria bacterium RIFCSPHIGHO2_01_FULL_37_10 TaxID=1802489 RepID=A0A1F7XUL4_9BACT|nr:MAG: signal peptidase I [Candidatus Woesebacteria bacterium RIFCSPHIGHO2_01_FULL_37_10]